MPRFNADPSRILAAITEASADAIIVTDLRGTVQSWNGGAERLFGYTDQETIGRSIARIVPSDRPGELSTILDRIREGRRIEPHDTVRVDKSGRTLDVSLTVSPVEDASGHVVGAAATARVVDARLHQERASQEAEARWRALIDSAVDGIVVIDASGAIEVFNRAAERMFGYTEQELLGRNVSLLMPSPHREEHDGYLSRHIQTGEQRIIGIGRDVTALRRDGDTFPVHLSVGDMRVGTERHFTGILHDLSARAELE